MTALHTSRRALMAALALAGSGLAPARAQERVTLRLHHFLPAQSSFPAGALQPWAKSLEQASGGRLRVQLFPAMQLGGKPADLLGQARDGVVDLAWTVLGYTPGRFPKSEVFELPFIAGHPEASSRAFFDYVSAHAMDEFKDFKPLALHTHSPGLFHGRKPIGGLGDVKGMRIRGGSRIINMMLEQLGAVAVGMPATQVAEALSRGVLESATLPWEVVPSLKVEQIVKHHTGFSGPRGLYTQTFGLLMNRAAYARLPADLQRLIDAHSGGDVSARFGRVAVQGDARGLAAAQKAGNRIVTLDAAETARWQQAAAHTRQRWFDELKTKGLDGPALARAAQTLIDTAHRQLPAQA